MSYKTTWEKKGIVWEYSGVVSPEDILNSNKEFYQDSKSDSTTYQIVDLSNIDNIDLDEFSVEAVAAMDFAESLSVRNVKVAFVISVPGIKEAINKYIELAVKLQTSWSFKIFDDINSAREWVSGAK